MIRQKLVIFFKSHFFLVTLYFSFFFHFSVCLAKQKTFFNEIQIKPKEFQKKILEHRLQFISKRRVDLKIKDTVRTYLETEYSDNRKKINFIISLLNKAVNKKKLIIERKILSSAIRFCIKSQCIFLLESLPQIKYPEIINKSLRNEILNKDLIGFHNYSTAIAKSFFLLELFDKLINDNEKNIEKMFSLAYKYGKDEYLNKKIKKYKKKLGNEIWFQYRECLSLASKNEYEKSKTCFQKNQEKNPWLKFGYLYISFLKGEKIKNKDVKKLDSMFGNKNRSSFIIFKIFFLKQGTKEMFSGLNLKKVVRKYEFGYYFFLINRHYNIFRGQELEDLKKRYNRKFEDSLLQRVLKGEINRKQLAQFLGKDSIYYQFYVRWGGP